MADKYTIPPDVFDTNTFFYVSWLGNASIFHRRRNCVESETSSNTSTSLGDCKKQGLRPCKICMPDAYEPKKEIARLVEEQKKKEATHEP